MKQAELSPASPAARRRAPYAHVQKPSKPAVNPQWKILGDLVTGMRYLPINAGAIATLRALLSCRADAGTVVYAGNRCLAKRADGIDERTLTRHLSHLCQIGFLARKCSPNGKRFAKKRGQGQVEIFGIDLAPFFERATELALLARRAEEEDRLVDHLRDTLSELRYLLQTNGLAPDLVEELALQRRRKPNLPVMRSLELKARALLEEAKVTVTCTSPGDLPVARAADLSANDSQNVCHIQNHPHRESQPRALHEAASPVQHVKSFELDFGREETAARYEPARESHEEVCRYADEVLAGFRAKLAGNIPVSENVVTAEAEKERRTEGVPIAFPEGDAETETNSETTQTAKQPEGNAPTSRKWLARREGHEADAGSIPLSVDAILAACPTARSLEPDHPSSWSELVQFAWKIGGWLGFHRDLMSEACTSLGQQGLAVTLLGLCERQDKLRQPAAYLRSVMRRPGFRPESLLGLAAGDARFA